MANMDNVASRKPSPELIVNTTKQMRRIFILVHNLRKEFWEGTASIFERNKHMSISMAGGQTITKADTGQSKPCDIT